MSGVILKSTDGMIYTNGKEYARISHLGTGDSPDNWWEITEAEYNKITEEVMNYEEDLH